MVVAAVIAPVVAAVIALVVAAVIAPVWGWNATKVRTIPAEVTGSSASHRSSVARRGDPAPPAGKPGVDRPRRPSMRSAHTVRQTIDSHRCEP